MDNYPDDTYDDCRVPSERPFPDFEPSIKLASGDATFATGDIHVNPDGSVDTRFKHQAGGSSIGGADGGTP